MKKSKSMRTAAVLLVCTLITSCIYSGTLAKYVTSDSAADSARVAKWGITISAIGNLFGDQYSSTTGKPVSGTVQTGDSISVQISDGVSATEDVIAPGTKNTEGMTIQISGTPEVATKLMWSSSVFLSSEDIFLTAKRGTETKKKYGVLEEVDGVTEKTVQNYYYMSSSNPITFKKAAAGSYNAATTYYAMSNQVTLENRTNAGEDADYYPIRWKLKILGLTEEITSKFYTFKPEMTFEDCNGLVGCMNEYLAFQYGFEDYSDDGSQMWTTCDAGTSIDVGFNITWEWAYEADQYKEMIDGADTILGLLASHRKQVEKVGAANVDWYVVMQKEGETDIYVLPIDRNDLTDPKGAYDYNLETVFDFAITATQVD